ncbi:hypothetical protein C2845_PM15G13650 [Panicum miliaceum]|uniref:Uncharacterized protein n=1 Tax=Panicum miliaceum TaxID=4540 RepID=A0A3L6Q7T0_PANMI|nr:hypothetical protein C2845_PM15G13650 [Panicum miliaceum]
MGAAGRREEMHSYANRMLQKLIIFVTLGLLTHPPYPHLPKSPLEAPQATSSPSRGLAAVAPLSSSHRPCRSYAPWPPLPAARASPARRSHQRRRTAWRPWLRVLPPVPFLRAVDGPARGEGLARAVVRIAVRPRPQRGRHGEGRRPPACSRPSSASDHARWVGSMAARASVKLERRKPAAVGRQPHGPTMSFELRLPPASDGACARAEAAAGEQRSAHASWGQRPRGVPAVVNAARQGCQRPTAGHACWLGRCAGSRRVGIRRKAKLAASVLQMEIRRETASTGRKEMDGQIWWVPQISLSVDQKLD